MALVGGTGFLWNLRRVDLMDLSTGDISHLPDMIHVREKPVCVANDSQLYALSDCSEIFYTANAYSGEVYDAALKR